MEKVQVLTKDLLSKIKQNREKYVAELAEAQIAYRDVVVREMQKNLKKAKNGGQIVINIPHYPPQDHTKDYDRVIAMLEMSTEDEVEITNTQFAQYVMDDWSWKQDFLNTTDYYFANSKVGAKRP